ncbi:DUF2510 domain-containing protein [Propionibacteriaceae bacterium Y1923]
MASAGWYPDPSGTPGQVRYFDGNAWTSDVMAAEHAAQPDPGQGGKGGRAGLLVAIVAVVAISLLVWLLVRPGGNRAAFPEDTNSAEPTISAWDETSTPTPTPTPSTTDPSGATRVDCPSSGGDYGDRRDGNRRVGGQLSFESQGWTQGGFYMPFTHDVSAESRQIQFGWHSNLAVGALLKSDGFTDPAASANAMTQCLASSSYFSTYTGHNTLISEPITIDGLPGHRMVTEIYVAVPANVRGDRVTVIVVDTGHDAQLSFFVSAATITNPGNIAEVEAAEKTLEFAG